MARLRNRIEKTLLGQVNGKPVSQTAQSPQEPENFTDPPIQSSDEEAEEPVSNDDSQYADVDLKSTLRGAEHEHHGSVKGKKSSPVTAPRSQDRYSVAHIGISSSRQQVKSEIDIEAVEKNGALASKRKATTFPDKLSSEIGDHMRFEPGVARPRKRVLVTYGKKGRGLAQSRFQRRKMSDSASPRNFQSKQCLHEAILEDVPSMPTLKIPDGFENDYISHAPISKSIDTDMLIHKTPAERQIDPGMASCPICEEQVDKEWLKDFSKNQYMTIRRQMAFCHMHKMKTARSTWEAKGYPSIVWGSLEQRIQQQHNYLESLIRGEPSNYGGLLWEKIMKGESKTLLTVKDYPTPGYYGLRGMSLMTETITGMFSTLLRERAPQDKLISARGYMIFVQLVLVPELAVRLIQEDMSLDQVGARKVMEESRAVGEILNDEEHESSTLLYI